MDEHPIAFLNETIDIRTRLQELRMWQEEWKLADDLLAERIRALDPKKYLDVQKGSQIAILRRRLRMQLVKKPLEIKPEIIRRVGYQELRQHLVTQFAELSKAEKLLWLQNFLFIMTPDLRKLNDKIAQVRKYRALGQQRNFLLGGHSGMGKTTFLDWFTSHELPKVELERTHVPIIKIDAPVSNHTPKPLFQRMILECGMNYLKHDNEEELLMKLALYFQLCGIEVVIIDEVEHITRPEIRRRLLEVSNMTPGVPFICASCEPLKWISGDTEVEGRWNDFFHLKQYTGRRLQQLLSFINLLLPFPQDSFADLQLDKSAKGVVQDERSDVLIEQWTGGILRDIMVLVVSASIRALEQDLSYLNLQLLKETWQQIQTN